MGGLFTELNGHVTEDQIKQINKTGIVPSAAKSPEDKTYCVIFRSWKIVLVSQVTEREIGITGEAFIILGRKPTFNTIKEYMMEGGEDTVDIRNSLVMVEGVDAANAVSLYRFILLCNEAYPDEAVPEETLNDMLRDFIDEEEVRESVAATGNGNYCGTLLREQTPN